MNIRNFVKKNMHLFNKPKKFDDKKKKIKLGYIKHKKIGIY